MQSEPGLEEILNLKTSEEGADRSIRLFANHARLKTRGLRLLLPYSTSGFLPPDGPFPQWNLPVVRWGLYPESRIVLPDTLKGKALLMLSARRGPAKELKVVINGREIYRHLFAGESFKDITVPLSLSAGKNVISLQYDSSTEGADQLKRSLLFQDIRIILPRNISPPSAEQEP